jgi:predicted acetyltransferase
MSNSPFTVRWLDSADLDRFIALIHNAFLGFFAGPRDTARHRAMLESERVQGVFDGADMVGGVGLLTRRMTLPMSEPQPIVAQTTGGVSPAYRRRGVLAELIRVQFNGLHESGGEPVAALWASQAEIYSRFGYGVAAHLASLTLPGGARLRRDVVVDDDDVRELPAEQAVPMLRELYAKVAPKRVGWIDRSEQAWRLRLSDFDRLEMGMSDFRYAVHPEGYVVYRMVHNLSDLSARFELVVHELVSTTPSAYAALWRHLLSMDLVASVHYHLAALDEPITYLLSDPRAATRTVADSLWVRLVDLDRALLTRGYSAPLATVFEVTDGLCPWNAGRWEFVVEDDGQCRVGRTDAPAQLELDIADLGAAFLGGTTLSSLGAAGRVRELRPGALRAASLAFLGDHEPHCPEIF